jgi:hypothetical protein
MSDISIALEVSPEGERGFQEGLLNLARKGQVSDITVPSELYRSRGAILRVWGIYDSDDDEFSEFIDTILDHIDPNDYRYVFISPHGCGEEKGNYEGPHNLRMVHFPDLEYDTGGTHVPEPATLPESPEVAP